MSRSISEIEVEVGGLFGEAAGTAGPLARNVDLVHETELESVQIMEVIVDIEDLYDIAIDLEGLSKVRTVAELATLVHGIISA